ncbi:MAG: hypothetical protein LBQ18_05975 [Campylobacteraceae bacterium]|nr:hypothetical protein [Campylobacteraceae bacterium]
MYGITSADELSRQIVDITKTLGGGINAALLLAETAAAETDYGNALSAQWSDVGVMQFTSVGFKDVQARTTSARKATIYSKYGVNIDALKLGDLAYSPQKSVIFARLLYLLRPGNIPATLEKRAAYWKQYYNSTLGAGTVEHYIRSAKANEGNINKVKELYGK